MPYEMRRSPLARQDIRALFRRLKKEGSEQSARRYLEQLEHDLLGLITGTPNSFNWFHETGAPYRAKLFRLAKTTYWIV